MQQSPEKLQEAAAIEQLILECVVGQIVELLQDEFLVIRTVGYGGRPPLARDGRGTAISISSASAAKSTCLLRSTSGSPSFERRFPRSSSANRLGLGIIIMVGFVVQVDIRILPASPWTRQRFLEVSLSHISQILPLFEIFDPLEFNF